jgi:hypothetical protein
MTPLDIDVRPPPDEVIMDVTGPGINPSVEENGAISGGNRTRKTAAN